MTGGRAAAPVRILAVDDHPVNLKLVRTLLGSEGYDIRTALGAEQALAEIASHPPALILMDLQMPGMDGFQLTQRLKDDMATRDIVIVAVTAYAMKGDEERALAAGCDFYLSKPFDTRSLPAFIASCLRRPA